MNVFKLLKGFVDNLPPAVKAEMVDIGKQVYTQVKVVGIAWAISWLTTRKK